MQIGWPRTARLLAAVPLWCRFAVLWLAAALPAQVTWVGAGTPPPGRHVQQGPLPFSYPFKPERAFFDDSRGRANCLFVNTGNVTWATYANAVEFDGAAWTTAPTQGPYAILTDSPIGADPRGAGMQVHFGGRQSWFVVGDTNIWNPVARSWSIVNPATRPAARFSHSLALLPGVGTVMFGGDTTVPLSGGELDDTWFWDGSDWREVQTSPRPSPRTAAAMAFDPATGELLLFGGGGLTDTWSFNGTRWLQRQPQNSPPPGSVQAITDPVRGHVVLFGGTIGGGNPFRNDTWTWNGSDWSLRAPAHSPPPRTEARLVWDTLWQRVLMLSGWTGGNGLPDTWAWDGTDWTELRNTNRPTTVVPWARSFATLTQDAQGRTVLFGGQVRQGIQEIPLTDTWEGADRTWQRRTPANSPPPSFANAGTVLRSTGAVSWFPGVGQFGGAVNQLWTWTGSNWTGVPLQTASLTPLHQVAGSLQSSQLGWVLVRLVTTGPAPFLSHTLQLVVPGTGIVQPMFPAGGPSPRTGSAMTQATSATVHGNKVWLFGGGGSAPYFNDVWELADTGSGGNLAWTQRLPAAWSPVPPGRAHAAFAYDELRNRLVVVGGNNGSSLGDTWTFD
ncbi:MAG: hypothetical protein IPK26_25510, partial [Planctomycetes bacterium]|nr:hypothetical protein [Planctomycetota bacterium]